MNQTSPTVVPRKAPAIVVSLSSDKELKDQLETLIQSQGYQVKIVSLNTGGSTDSDTQLLVVGHALSLQKAANLLVSLRAQSSAKPVPILWVDLQLERAKAAALLEAGADDVIAKPFDGKIFLARLNALLRRSLWSGSIAQETSPHLEVNSVLINLISRSVTVSGKPLELSRLEFDLLAFFMKSPGVTHSRKDILSAVWGYPEDVRTRTLDKHIESLRKELDSCSDYIQTMHGVGYCFSPNHSQKK